MKCKHDHSGHRMEKLGWEIQTNVSPKNISHGHAKFQFQQKSFSGVGILVTFMEPNKILGQKNGMSSFSAQWKKCA